MGATSVLVYLSPSDKTQRLKVRSLSGRTTGRVAVEKVAVGLETHSHHPRDDALGLLGGQAKFAVGEWPTFVEHRFLLLKRQSGISLKEDSGVNHITPDHRFLDTLLPVT